jgi:predicted nucleic acid-binding protein
MVMMVARVFADTNILLRAFHAELAQHTQVKALFDQTILTNTPIFISRQVIREYLVQVTHPRTFDIPLTMDEAQHHLAQIRQVCDVLDDTESVTKQLLALLKAYPTTGKQVHDANIVATMLAHDIDKLLTLNVADFRRFESRIQTITVNDI